MTMTTPKVFVLALLNSIFLLTGCATPPPATNGKHPCQSVVANASKDLSAYGLYINSNGNLYDYDKKPVADPNSYLEKIFQNYNRVANGDTRVQMTVFIHGGLNTSKQVSERIENLWETMLKDCKYPLFISWRSGFPGNYFDHLFFLRRGEYESPEESESIFEIISAFIKGPIASPFVFMEDSLRAIARFPATTYEILVDQNMIKRNLTDESTDNDALKEVEQINTLGQHDGIHIHLPPKEDETLAFTDLWSIANPVKLVTAPYVDSLGTGAWNSMLRRTDLVLAKDKGISVDQNRPEAFASITLEQECKVNVNEIQTAVSEFFRHWQCSYRNKAIHLIGHSMGSIIANKIIAKYPNINFSKIVYMAAACSLNDIAEIISPYLNNHPNSVFYNLSLHPKRDQFENASLVDVVPRGSLLWWIDNTLGTINSFQDRTAGYWPNIYKVALKIFPTRIQHQVHLTKFGMTGEAPQTHGNFGDFPFWEEYFWHGRGLGGP